MLASSWKATGLVQKAWHRLDVSTGKRERLAELTGIPATDLSTMNTGRRPMTLQTAQKIVAVVPGLTVADLGAPEEVADEAPRTILERLDEQEAHLAEALGAIAEVTRRAKAMQAARTRQVRALEARIGQLEAQLEQRPAAPARTQGRG